MCFAPKSDTPQAPTNPAPYPLDESHRAVERTVSYTDPITGKEVFTEDGKAKEMAEGQTGQAPGGPSGITKPRM